MDKIKNKRFYKVISLFIKSILLILSFGYIYIKLRTTANEVNFRIAIDSLHFVYFIFIAVFMFFNWGLEAIKWKILIAPLESISFPRSMRSIFAGVTLSIFTPNRIGEFAGRIFFLDQADKIQASIMSMIGSAMQLIVTIIMGVLAYSFLALCYPDLFQTAKFISPSALLWLIVATTFIISIIVFIYLKRKTLFFKYKKYIDVLTMYPMSELLVVIGLSLIRYFVFSLQFYFSLKLFGINSTITILFSLIALTFFVTSAIPTFALTEIAVRGATAVYFFTMIEADATSVIAASLLLWVVNLALPAMIGSVFVWKLKFFKDQE